MSNVTVKRVISGSTVKRVITSSTTLRLEREAIFQLEDAEYQRISPTRSRLYHPAGIPVGVIDSRLITSEVYDRRGVTFICDDELHQVLARTCKRSNLAGCRTNERRF